MNREKRNKPKNKVLNIGIKLMVTSGEVDAGMSVIDEGD